MDQLFHEQSRLGDEIINIVGNFKKDSEERKTMKYYEQRLRLLQAAIQKFIANDEVLRKSGDRTQEYFTKDYFVQTKSLSDKYEKHFKQALESLLAGAINNASDDERISLSNDGVLGLIRKALYHLD